MSYKFNPFTGNFDEVSGVANTSWKDSVADVASLPAAGNVQGDVRVVRDSWSAYVWSSAAWVFLGLVKEATGIGSSPNNQGYSISADNTLTLQPADGTHSGVLSIAAQTIAGVKTFSSAPILSSLTASQAIFTDGSKNLVSNAITGTGNVVMSASPTLSGTPLFSGSSSGTTGLQASAVASGTLTLPAATDTLIGKATSDVLTNKTLSTDSSNLIGATAIAGTTGSGSVVFGTSPTLTTPTIASIINIGTLTLPTSTDTLVGKATSDVLTNKTLTGNTAANLISGSGTLVLNTTGTITIPNATDTLVGQSTSDVLINKTIAAGSNTITGLTNTNLSGSAGITGANIATNTVANSNLAQMAANTIKGNNTGSTANAADLTVTQVKTMLGFSAGDLPETSFSAANNTSSPTNVTGLAFANATVRSAKVLLSVFVDATADLFESFEMLLIQRGADWQMAVVSLGDISGFVFTVTTGGQIQYVNSNYTGFSSATVKFRAITTTV